VCSNFQLFDGTSFTFTYLLADAKTKDAIIIDPVIEQVERDVRLVQDMGLNLLYARKFKLLNKIKAQVFHVLSAVLYILENGLD